ncbi:hypothetical protein BO71DRAFT_332435 [Aspergillus ellipticus CBS 707.79]|uniref:Sigma-54 factor interaction domain-containing protein n=1 Tax=Aspergillus ellipticus CBS 707.79 TaxID=1448320 RepID=A0A319D279_9EURO|nr:hypothetical protein BO71DRAFT_332435 [Aspergillus ellipticus CBS 707.79]
MTQSNGVPSLERPRDSQDLAAEGSSSSSRDLTAVGGKDPSTSLSVVYRIADTSWEEKAICYFFEQYTIVDDIPGSPGHLGFVPSLYAVCRDQSLGSSASSSLRLAVDATSLIAMSNLVGAPSLVAQARNRFGLALQRLQAALNSPVEAVKDETFATLVILTLFEDISGDRNGFPSSHTLGFDALMKLRGDNQLVHAQGLDMFKFAFVHMQVESLVLREKPRFDVDWLVQRLDSTDPLQQLMIIAAGIAPLVCEPSSISNGLGGASITQLAEWIDSCRKLDTELFEWSHSVPGDGLPLAIRSHTGEDVLTYREMIIASIWLHYRVGRMMVHLVLIDLFRTLASTVKSPGIQREASQQEAESIRICQDLITESCQSIPFTFGEVDLFGNPLAPSTGGKHPVRAFYIHSMMWPLWFILTCDLTTPTQAQMIRSVLSRSGTTLGIKLALFLANTSREDVLASIASNPGMSSFAPSFTQSMGDLYSTGGE